MKVTFKTGSEANYGSTNGELFFASNTKQIMLNGIKYIPKKLSELTNDSGFISSITKSMVEGVLTGNITSHTHTFASLTSKPTTLGGYGITDIKHVRGYNRSNGCLVKTKVSGTGTFVRLHIYGTTNSPSLSKGFKPICTIVDCYNFDTNTIELNATHFGDDFGIISAFIYNGYLCFWFKQSRNYTAFNVYGYITNKESNIYNIVSEITNESIPSENVSNLITVTPTKIAYTFGTSSHFLKGDGSLDSNTYALSSALNNYLPLTGGTLTDNLTCNGTITATTFNGSLNGTATNASKLVTARTITVGSASKSFDGSGDIEFALNSIITQSDTINVGEITVAEKLTADKIEVKNNLNLDGADISGLTPSMIGAAEASHTHTFASLESKPSTLSGYGITNAMYFYEEQDYLAAKFNNTAHAKKAANTYIELWQAGGWFNLKAGKFITAGGTSSQFLKGDGSLDSNTYAPSSALNNYLPLSGGTLEGALTVPKLTSTGGIVLGDSSLSAMVGSVGIQRYDETGFIGFLKDFNLGNSFNGVVLGWDGNYSLSTNSVRIDSSTFTYKGNSVWHNGNLKLGYISSGLSRAVQKDTNGNLFIVAPSLFEQGISNNYPKNLRWSNETEGQLVYEKEIEAGNFDTVEIGIPLANGTSKGFLKSTSTVTNVTGYTPCPVVSGTPYYKLDAIELDYTDLGIVSGSIESNVPINTTIQQDGNLGYLLNYTVDNIPRLLTIALGSYCKYFFWLQQTDDDTPIVAYYHCQFNNLWLVIDSPNMEVRISQGGF